MDARGVPLSLVVTGANQHDITALKELLGNLIVSRPARSRFHRQHLFADKGYDSNEVRRELRLKDYVPQIPHRRCGRWKHHEIKQPKRKHRWVVELCHSWLNRFRKLLVRYEKKTSSYVALVQLACSIIALRKVGVIYG